jgi:hypothetical protein
MSALLHDFLAAAVPRPGRPARVDLRAPATSWFVDAFTAASDLLVGTSQTDRPDTLAAAVREAERRWALLDTWTRQAACPQVPPARGPETPEATVAPGPGSATDPAVPTPTRSPTPTSSPTLADAPKTTDVPRSAGGPDRAAAPGAAAGSSPVEPPDDPDGIGPGPP